MQLTTKQKLVGVAVAAVFIGGGSAAYAVSRGGTTAAAEKQAFLRDAAGRLGVDPAKLDSALKAAAAARVDAAVKRGELTKQQGAAIKKAIRSGQASPLRGPGFGGRGGGLHGMHGMHGAFMNGVADFLGLTREQLRSKLQTQTLAEVAEAQGKSVPDLKAAIVDSTKKELDQAVSAGRLTEAQASEMLNRLRANLDEIVNRSLKDGPRGGMHGPPPGGQGFQGPPSGMPSGPMGGAPAGVGTGI